MMEAAVVIDNQHRPIYWHIPHNRSVGALPDSRTLWDILWVNRDIVLGVAHTHPGSGPLGPSQTDLTTFAAIDQALGRRLQWWIANADSLATCSYDTSAGRYETYDITSLTHHPRWCDFALYKLRHISGLVKEVSDG